MRKKPGAKPIPTEDLKQPVAICLHPDEISALRRCAREEDLPVSILGRKVIRAYLRQHPVMPMAGPAGDE